VGEEEAPRPLVKMEEEARPEAASERTRTNCGTTGAGVASSEIIVDSECQSGVKVPAVRPRAQVSRPASSWPAVAVSFDHGELTLASLSPNIRYASAV